MVTTQPTVRTGAQICGKFADDVDYRLIDGSVFLDSLKTFVIAA